MSEERLLGIRSKIERAKKHIREFDSIVQEIRDLKPYESFSEHDRQTGQNLIKVRMRSTPFQLPELGIIAGEVAHQLRSILDHLAWQLVESGGAVPDRFTCFPICETLASFKASDSRKVKGIKPAGIDLIEAVQPYQAGYDGLRIIQELDNVDKHRVLLIVAVKPRFASVTFTDGPPTPESGRVMFGIQFNDEVPWRNEEVLKDGTVIGGFTGMTLRPGVNQDFEIAFDVALADSQFGNGQPVARLLSQLSGLVEGIVALFEPLL